MTHQEARGKVQIAKNFQTEIKSYTINLTCKCGGNMSYSSVAICVGYSYMIVKCDKCHKSSSLTIYFNDYKKDGK